MNSPLALLLVLAAIAMPASAQQATQATPPVAAEAAGAKPIEATLVGEYQLAGVMETGSGLLLRADGSFEWYFSYGALDLGARGTWTRLGDAVELVVVDMGFPPQVPQAKFDRMRLRIDGSDLVPSWPWDMDGFGKGAERGRYQRLSP